MSLDFLIMQDDGGAEAPAEETTETPAEETTEAPAEETDEAPAEEAPAEEGQDGQ